MALCPALLLAAGLWGLSTAARTYVPNRRPLLAIAGGIVLAVIALQSIIGFPIERHFYEGWGELLDLEVHYTVSFWLAVTCIVAALAALAGERLVEKHLLAK
jgi:hypothetical protein